MTKYKKTTKVPCQKCSGSGRRRNKWGASIRCHACSGTGKQTETVIVEEINE